MSLYVVGLTGGIGSGKSTVAKMFQEHGATLVDTDLIAHQLSAPNQPGALAVAELFGTEYLTAEGAIDRPKLRQKVFGEAEEKLKLDSALHPLIRTAVLGQLASIHAVAPYCILAVPLLFETNAYRDVISRALVIDCNEETQISRVIFRSALTEFDVRAIMGHQLPRNERLARADDVILNDGDLAQLVERVKELHQKYVQASESEQILP